MRIRCVANKPSILSDETKKKYSSQDDVVDLTLGEEYPVYSVYQSESVICFSIQSVESLSFPLWYPHEFFEIIDPSISRYWIGTIRTFRDNAKGLFFSFPEWVNDEYFGYNLLEGEEKEIGIYQRYKALMDLEFPNNGIKEKAQIGDDLWLICPTCMDAWESSDSENAMVICPKCRQMKHNPRYTHSL